MFTSSTTSTDPTRSRQRARPPSCIERAVFAIGALVLAVVFLVVMGIAWTWELISAPRRR